MTAMKKCNEIYIDILRLFRNKFIGSNEFIFLWQSKNKSWTDMGFNLILSCNKEFISIISEQLRKSIIIICIHLIITNYENNSFTTQNSMSFFSILGTSVVFTMCSSRRSSSIFHPKQLVVFLACNDFQAARFHAVTESICKTTFAIT